MCGEDRYKLSEYGGPELWRIQTAKHFAAEQHTRRQVLSPQLRAAFMAVRAKTAIEKQVDIHWRI